MPKIGPESATSMAVEPREAVVHGSSQGFTQEITMADHRLVADEPRVLGGTETEPNPYDLLIAALGACTSMTVSMYARRKAVAARGGDRAAATLEDPRGRLANLFDERGTLTDGRTRELLTKSTAMFASWIERHR